jgi:hypothetical protein
VGKHGFAVVVLALMLSYGCVVAQRHSLWLDEISTYLIATSGSLQETWRLLANGPQTDPPLFYLASRGSMAVLGTSSLGFRLPSVLGVAALAVAVYAFVARRCPIVMAQLAMLFVVLPPVTRYMTEGRPYGMWMGWSGLALLCWQGAGDAQSRSRWIWLVGLAVASAASVATHFYAVLFLAALGLAEAIRTWIAHRISPGVWLALGCGGIPLLFLGPLIAHGKAFIPNSWAAPGWDGALKLYRDLLQASPAYSFVFTALVVMAALGRWVGGYDRGLPACEDECLTLADLAAALAIAGMPCLGFVLAKFYTNNLHLRYVLPTVCGFAILVAAAAGHLARGRAWVCRLLVALAGLLLAQNGYAALGQDPGSSPAKLAMVQEAGQRAALARGILLTTSPSVLLESYYHHLGENVAYACGFRKGDNFDEITRHARHWCTIMEQEDLAKRDCYVIVPEITGTEVLKWFMDQRAAGWKVVAEKPLRGGESVYCARRESGPADSIGISEAEARASGI